MNTEPTQRFSERVQWYKRCRPNYPHDVVRLFVDTYGLTSDDAVVDVGSGTGILTKLFLDNGNTVIGVEPNDAMRAAAEAALGGFANFRSVNGTAENTTLPKHTAALATAGQAFHWFDPQASRNEFRRILQTEGRAALIWNERRLDATPFLRDYERFLIEHGTDYLKVDHHQTVSADVLEHFYGNRDYAVHTFENSQRFDLEGLRGRVLSSSYTPDPSHPRHSAMMQALESLFRRHQSDGAVVFEYDTVVYVGRIA